MATNHEKQFEQSISSLDLKEIFQYAGSIDEINPKTKENYFNSETTETENGSDNMKHIYPWITFPFPIESPDWIETRNRLPRSEHQIRRHSSFEQRQRRKIYLDHQEIQQYFENCKNLKAINADRKLFDLEVSANIPSMLGSLEIPFNLRASCPTLIFFHEDEEDSLDLSAYRDLKKRSLHSSIEDTLESWESLDDDVSYKSLEYETSIKIEELFDKTLKKRRGSFCCIIPGEKFDSE
jgi:hypothetical protein